MNGRIGVRRNWPWMLASLAVHLLLLACMPALDSERHCPVMLLVTISSPKAAELTTTANLPAQPIPSSSPAPTQVSEQKSVAKPAKPAMQQPKPQPQHIPPKVITSAKPAADPAKSVAKPLPEARHMPLEMLEQPIPPRTRLQVPKSNGAVDTAEKKSSTKPAVAPPATPAKPAIDIDALKRSYGAGVINKVQGAKYFPDSARDPSRAGESVAVRLSFVVTSGGQLAGVSVSSGSGVPAIDAAAQDALRRAAPFGAFPADLDLPQLNLAVTLRYTLN